MIHPWEGSRVYEKDYIEGYIYLYDILVV